jgi:uncharacterized Zn finger protein
MQNNSTGKDSIDQLCENCGETFSEFLHEIAEQNAKVATCPKCGKIHEFPLKPTKLAARDVRPAKRVGKAR